MKRNDPNYGRRKIICKSCQKSKIHFGHGMCSPCLRKFKRQHMPHFYLGTCYSEIKRRCTSKNHNSSPDYFGLPFCSKTEFMELFFRDSNFLNLYLQWQESSFQRKFAPSIDRINSKLGYVPGNMQFIRQGENSVKDLKIPIAIRDRYGKLVGQFTSINEAARILKINVTTIWHWLNGKKSRLGWKVWRLNA